MEIKVLGPGCPSCTKLYETVEEAVKATGRTDIELLKVTDMLQIAVAGIMSTPGLVIDGKLKHTGKPIPTVEKVIELIKAG